MAAPYHHRFQTPPVITFLANGVQLDSSKRSDFKVLQPIDIRVDTNPATGPVMSTYDPRDDTLELTGPTSTQQQQVVDAWLMRHSPTPDQHPPGAGPGAP